MAGFASKERSAPAGQAWPRPSDWGAFFLVFPSGRPWEVPAGGWHADADYAGPLAPPKGLKVHARFGDVEPHAGGMPIISGSHRLVSRWFVEHPPRPAAKAAELRTSVLQHPYQRALCADGDPAERAAPPTTHLGSAPRFLLNKDIQL